MATQSQTIYPAGRKKDSDEAGRGIYRMLHSDVLTDSVASFFLSAGLCLALIPLTLMNGGWWDTACCVAGSVAALAVLRIRWWIGPSLAGLWGAASLLYYYRTEQLGLRFSYWRAFAGWILAGSPQNEFFSESPGLVFLKYAMVFGITLVLFFLLRKCFSFVLFVAALGGVMIPVDLYGVTNLIAPIAVYMVGLVILLPRVHARMIRKASGRDGHRRASMQIIAIPGAVLVILMALWITPGDTAAWRMNRLSNFFYDIGYLFGGPFEVYTDGSTNFGLSVLGMQPQTDRLGGPAYLPEWHMLTVITEKPILLRGAVMDSYTGSQWTVGEPDGDFRYEGLFWRGQREEAFGGGMPLGGPEAEALYGSISDEITMQITYETEYYTTLFTNGQLIDMSFGNPSLYQDAFFNMRSELYLSRLVPGKETVTMRTRMLRQHSPEFEESFLRLERLAANAGDGRFAEVSERYTALPDTLPEELVTLSAGITAGEQSPYRKAVAIAAWLGENNTYTLNPPLPPEGRDFVAYFLETGEGYCTYYASAMAVMARCAGIPSRYITGFALERDFSRENTYYATGKTSHAWTELYFDGIGWVTFDPLLWNADEPLNRFEEQGGSAAISPFFEEEEEIFDPYAYLGDLDLRNDGLSIDFRVLLGVTAGGLVIFAAGYVLQIWGSKYRKYQISRVLRKFPGMPERFGYYYSDIMRQLALLGYETHPGETLLQYPGRVDRLMGLGKSGFAPIAETQMKLHFAGKEPTTAELEVTDSYHRLLEDRLREKLSKPQYLWRRARR